MQPLKIANIFEKNIQKYRKNKIILKFSKMIENRIKFHLKIFEIFFSILIYISQNHNFLTVRKNIFENGLKIK